MCREICTESIQMWDEHQGEMAESKSKEEDRALRGMLRTLAYDCLHAEITEQTTRAQQMLEEETLESLTKETAQEEISRLHEEHTLYEQTVEAVNEETIERQQRIVLYHAVQECLDAEKGGMQISDEFFGETLRAILSTTVQEVVFETLNSETSDIIKNLETACVQNLASECLELSMTNSEQESSICLEYYNESLLREVTKNAAVEALAETFLQEFTESYFEKLLKELVTRLASTECELNSFKLGVSEIIGEHNETRGLFEVIIREEVQTLVASCLHYETEHTEVSVSLEESLLRTLIQEELSEACQDHLETEALRCGV